MTFLWQAPVVVASFIAWFASPPAGLADMAARETVRRELTAKSAHTLTTADLPASSTSRVGVEPGAAGAAPTEKEDTSGDRAVPGPPQAAAAPVAASSDHDEAWWRDRVATARSSMDHDQVLADALQSHLNALATDIANRDDPYQRGQLQDQFQKASIELQKLQTQVQTEQKAIDQILEEGRRAAVPPGWLR